MNSALENLRNTIEWAEGSNARAILIVRTNESTPHRLLGEAIALLENSGYEVRTVTSANMHLPSDWDIARILVYAQSYESGASIPQDLPQGPLALLLPDVVQQEIYQSDDDASLWRTNLRYMNIVSL